MAPERHLRSGHVALPADFVERLLPQITSLVELKVTLHFFGLVAQQHTRPKRISWEMLLMDADIERSLRVAMPHMSVIDLLSEGLAAAVRRGTLVHVARPDRDGRMVNWYLANTASNVAWVAEQTIIEPPQVTTSPPTVVALYEQHIGVVTPMILAELQHAAQQYPVEWIQEAMREAVLANVRSWRYVAKILARWARDGRGERASEGIDVGQYTNGAYGDLFRRGSDTSDLESMS